MNKLILHIGTHKTGSTAIQFWLGANRDRLATQGVLYPRTDRDPDPNLHKHSSLHHALIAPTGDFGAEWQLIQTEFDRSGCHTMILSAEGLGAPRFHSFAPLRSLADRFEITVIGLFRRQDYLVEALWNELCKQGKEAGSISAFARRQDTQTRLDYARILNFWADFATVRARAYPEHPGGDAIACFSAAAGLAYDGSVLHVNPSPSMNCAAACAWLNWMGTPGLSSHMPTYFRADRRKYALGRALRTEILDSVAESNRRLAGIYGVEFSADRPTEDARPITVPSLGSVLRGIWLR